MFYPHKYTGNLEISGFCVILIYRRSKMRFKAPTMRFKARLVLH